MTTNSGPIRARRLTVGENTTAAPPREAPTLTAVEAWDKAHLWRFRASLIRVVDADTIVVLTDQGFDGRHEPAIRLAGVNAPEKRTPEGKAAAWWLIDQMTPPLDQALAIGRWNLRVETLQLETVIKEATSFERWVATVAIVQPDGRMIDLGTALVAAGHATRTGV